MTVRRLGRTALCLCLVVALLRLVPGVTGTDWTSAAALLRDVSPLQFAALVALWLLGLWAHTFVATAAMPRLTHRQALALNLCGSAVANVMPFGGAAGAGLNYRMVRSWGLGASSFAPFTALTTLANIVTKLCLPLLALGLLLADGGLSTPTLRLAAAAAGCLLALVLGTVFGVLNSHRMAHGTAALLQRVVAWTLRVARSPRRYAVDGALLDARRRVIVLLRGRWRQMCIGMAVYSGLQAALLWVVLHMLGSDLGIVRVFAGFAFGRVLTLLVITPGGVGVSEAGSAAVLVALGGDPAVVTAATLLFSGLTFALEIPVGGVTAVLWWRTSRAVA